MSTEKLEKQITAITNEMTEIERAPDRAHQRLVRVEKEISDLTVRIESSSSADAEDGIELTALLRERVQLKTTIAVLERDTEPKLRSLEKEQEQLRAELHELNIKLVKDQLAAEVVAYEQIMRQALPISDKIRALASRAGVTLESRNLLVHRDKDHMTIAGYPLKV